MGKRVGIAGRVASFFSFFSIFYSPSPFFEKSEPYFPGARRGVVFSPHYPYFNHLYFNYSFITLPLLLLLYSNLYILYCIGGYLYVIPPAIFRKMGKNTQKWGKAGLKNRAASFSIIYFYLIPERFPIKVGVFLKVRLHMKSKVLNWHNAKHCSSG